MAWLLLGLGVPLMQMACTTPRLRPQFAAPTPPAPADSEPQDLGDGPDGPLEETEDLPRQSATQWLEHAFNLWHAGHYAASVAAMREALGTQDLNDAGQAMAYWHIYLSEQALGHNLAARNALADFVAVGHDLLAWAEREGSGDPDTAAFVERFDLAGRLARARATLNLAWAKQTRRAGRSSAYPVLVFNDAEIEHFLQLAPPCAQAADRRVVAEERRQDRLGRATAKVTIRCRHVPRDQAYFFAFIGPGPGLPAPRGGTGARLTDDSLAP